MVSKNNKVNEEKDEQYLEIKNEQINEQLKQKIMELESISEDICSKYQKYMKNVLRKRVN